MPSTIATSEALEQSQAQETHSMTIQEEIVTVRPVTLHDGANLRGNLKRGSETVESKMHENCPPGSIQVGKKRTTNCSTE
eukprot:6387726-Amphidinium_carterae.1